MRKSVIAVSLAAAVLALPSTAHASPGGNNTSSCSSDATICLALDVRDATICGSVAGTAWQCTVALIATAVPAHGSRPPLTGGSFSWYASATCQVRERADGINNDWTSWRSCPQGSSKSYSNSRSWTYDQSPTGDSVQFNFGTESNGDTWLTTDCVEVRVSVYADGSAKSNTAGLLTLAETGFISTRFPYSGTNLDGVCEGGSAY